MEREWRETCSLMAEDLTRKWLGRSEWSLLGSSPHHDMLYIMSSVPYDKTFKGVRLSQPLSYAQRACQSHGVLEEAACLTHKGHCTDPLELPLKIVCK